MSRRRLRHALIGAPAAVALVALAGAAYGGFAGIQLYLDDGRPYHRPVGLDGAIAAAALWSVVGGLPAAAVGAVAGTLVGRPRGPETERAEPPYAPSDLNET